MRNKAETVWSDDAVVIRNELNRRIYDGPPGTQAAIQRTSGLSGATVSQFRNSAYVANVDRIAASLAETFLSMDMAKEVAAGDATTLFLICGEDRDVELVRTAQTRDKRLAEDPRRLAVAPIKGKAPAALSIGTPRMEAGMRRLVQENCGGLFFRLRIIPLTPRR